jgi:hypothetical protein
VRSAVLATAALCVALAAPAAQAHAQRTAWLELQELQPGSALVTWRLSVSEAPARPVFPPGCQAEPLGEPQGPSPLQSWRLRCEGPLAGRSLEVQGLGPLATEAVVRASRHGGTVASFLLTPESPAWRLPGSQGPWAVCKEYAALGTAHILAGPDHLLFLLALVLLVQRVGAVLWAETAFTLSHSLTYSATALGWLRVSSTAAEACIALSLVLLAEEVARGQSRPSPRGQGAALAFVFGLVHGLGFAGGLREVGLPQAEVPLALAGFALGVELGQVAFLAVALALVALAARLRLLRQACLAGAYAVGVPGAWWLFQRLTSF